MYGKYFRNFGGAYTCMSENITVAIADDQQMFLESVVAALNSHSVISIIGQAFSGKELLSKLHVRPVAVVVISLEISSLSGFNIISQLSNKFPGIKIIALTSLHSDELRKKCKYFGIDAYLPKECGLSLLIEAILTVQHKEFELSNEQVMRLFPDYSKLFSKMERKMLPLFCKGLSLKEVADYTTEEVCRVKTYRSRIYAKAEVNCLALLIGFVVRHKLLSIHEVAPLEERFYQE